MSTILLVAFCVFCALWTSPLAARQQDRGVAVHDAPKAQPAGRFLVAVVGVDEYSHWPKLHNAVNDAVGFQKLLVEKFGFTAASPPLINEKATREAILGLVEDSLRKELKPEDNLILFFSGHGHTRVDVVGGKKVETGYIVPVASGFGGEERWSDYIDMEEFLKNVSKLPAQHILVVLDSCYSGFALGNSMQTFRAAPRFVEDLLRRTSRQVITSARLDQVAQDGGPMPDHSLFTGSLIDGLTHGDLDLDHNGVVTSSEIGLGLQQVVGQATESKQTPDYGSFFLDDRGEMVLSAPGTLQASTGASRQDAPAICFSIQTKYPEVIPFSLKNSIESKDFLYWFHVDVTNHCAEPLYLQVAFKVRRGPAAVSSDVPAEYTVYPGTTLSQKVDPLLEFLSTDAKGTLEIVWRINNHKEALLQSGTARIELLPRDTVDWTLKTGGGEPVARDFLLASLAAWTLTPDPSIQEHADLLFQRLNSKEDTSSRWFAALYSALLHDSTKLSASPLRRFPEAGRQIIQAPANVLQRGSGNPVEIALLMGALNRAVSRQTSNRAAMLVVTENTDAPQQVFLAWAEGTQPWRAFEITQPALPFADNETGATQQLERLMTARPALARALETTGVFVDGSVLALNFDAAARHFYISGLP